MAYMQRNMLRSEPARHKAKNVIGRPLSRNDFDIEFNLNFDYVFDRAWALLNSAMITPLASTITATIADRLFPQIAQAAAILVAAWPKQENASATLKATMVAERAELLLKRALHGL